MRGAPGGRPQKGGPGAPACGSTRPLGRGHSLWARPARLHSGRGFPLAKGGTHHEPSEVRNRHQEAHAVKLGVAPEPHEVAVHRHVRHRYGVEARRRPARSATGTEQSATGAFRQGSFPTPHVAQWRSAALSPELPRPRAEPRVARSGAIGPRLCRQRPAAA